jgi:ubiquinone/menaquinone biosynthesis C-methylase UbiE
MDDPQKARSKQRFTRFAQSYVTSQTHAKGQDLDLLIEFARPRPEWIALDVATGGGHTALKFAPLVARVIATDITPRMLEVAGGLADDKGIVNVTFGLADAENLPFDDDLFDLVTCRIAPHHFVNCSGFVRQGSRVLKRGGLLLVQDHVLPEDEHAARYVDAFERLRDPSHNRAFSETEWLALFQAAGLQVDDVEQVNKRHAFLPWAERQGCAPKVIERLILMMQDADESVWEWMQPLEWGTRQATFANRHIIIAGRKGSLKGKRGLAFPRSR